MSLFNLPHTTVVGKNIPKNAFDGYTNKKQKKLFTDRVARITWTHKLSPDTVNLEAREIREIQIFEVELKIRGDIKPILDIIDKAIPYHILFVVECDGEAYISVSAKHSHPTNEDTAVVDWTFKSDWFSFDENKYVLQLRKSVDAIFHDFCIQISGDLDFSNRPSEELVRYKKGVAAIEKEIADIKSKMANCRQFNEKVQLNLLLKEKQAELTRFGIV